MSLAFQTLLILLVYLPGGFFVWSMIGGLSEDRDVPIPSASLTTLVVLSLTAAVLLHGLGGAVVLLIDTISHHRLQSLASDVFVFLSVANDKAPFIEASETLSHNLHWLAIYLLSLIVAAVVAGSGLNRLIRTRGLEVSQRALRFRPKWHYALSAEFLRRKLNSEVRIDVIVDALVDLQGGSQIYSGTVSDFWFDKQTNALEALLLSDVTRTPVVPPGGDPANVTPVAIAGESMVLKFADVRNLNIRYDSHPEVALPSDLDDLSDQLANLTKS